MQFIVLIVISIYKLSVPPINRHRQIILLLIHAIQTLAFCWPLEGSVLVLWLYQRHALKALRASVGDEEGQ